MTTSRSRREKLSADVLDAVTEAAMDFLLNLDAETQMVKLLAEDEKGNPLHEVEVAIFSQKPTSVSPK